MVNVLGDLSFTPARGSELPRPGAHTVLGLALSYGLGAVNPRVDSCPF